MWYTAHSGKPKIISNIFRKLFNIEKHKKSMNAVFISQCCACFGPDSKQDYCAPKCQAINGGTVLKEEDNITVWFWIRSSLPKRVWKQCMEFREKNRAGKLEIWRVEDGVKRKVIAGLS